MDLFQLRCFVAVSEELHFGRAAERLHMTQPPLSRQIQMLEASVEARLFERTSRNVALTPAGQALHGEAVKLLKAADAAVALVRATARGDTGRVVFGYTAVSGYVLIPRLLLLARQALPGIEIVLEEMVSSQQLRGLADETLDLAIVRPLTSDAALDFHRIVREPMQLALPAGHPLAHKRRITLADLDGQPLVMYSHKAGQYFHDMIRQLFVATGVQPRYLHHMGQTHAIVALVQAGIGLAIVPASARHLYVGEVVFRELWRQDACAELYLAWRRDDRRPAPQRLREFIVATVEHAAIDPGQEPDRPQ